GHILDGILDWNRNLASFANRPREHVALNRILVAGCKLFRSHARSEEVAPVVNEDPARPVVRGIKWNLNLDPPFRPQKLHSLIGHELGTASEDGLSRRELEDCRG